MRARHAVPLQAAAIIDNGRGGLGQLLAHEYQLMNVTSSYLSAIRPCLPISNLLPPCD